MAATVSLWERNGASPGSENEIDDDIKYGNHDSYNLVPVDYPIAPGANSYEKYHRLKVTDLDGNSAIENFKVWKSGGDALGSNTAIDTNARESSYANKTYATPVTTVSTQATQTMPTTEPTGPNLGIGGSLSGQITAINSYTDYLVTQVQIGANETEGKDIIYSYEWDEVP